MKPGLWPEGPSSPRGETKLSVTEVQWQEVAVGPRVSESVPEGPWGSGETSEQVGPEPGSKGRRGYGEGRARGEQMAAEGRGQRAD